MAAKKLARAAHETLTANRENAIELVRTAGLQRTRATLEAAKADLEDRLAAMQFADEETFTMVQMRATLAQVRLVLKQVAPELQATILDAGVDAAQLAADHAAGYLVAADEAFRGVGTARLALREASMFESAAHGARSSILRRLASSGEPVEGADEEPDAAKPGILGRYGISTIESFEEQLRKGVLAGKSWGDMQDDLTARSPFLQGKPAFWAERIVRTECMGAYNRGNLEAIRSADLDDMVKIMSAVFDDRTGADSYATHGQIRRPDEPFETWYGACQHPPDRPNDRGTVTPHRIAWEIPEYLEALEDDEVQARWEEEGRKGECPDRPEMTTVDLALFGKPQEPPELPEKGEDEPAPEE